MFSMWEPLSFPVQIYLRPNPHICSHIFFAAGLTSSLIVLALAELWLISCKGVPAAEYIILRKWGVNDGECFAGSDSSFKLLWPKSHLCKTWRTTLLIQQWTTDLPQLPSLYHLRYYVMQVRVCFRARLFTSCFPCLASDFEREISILRREAVNWWLCLAILV